MVDSSPNIAWRSAASSSTSNPNVAGGDRAIRGHWVAAHDLVLSIDDLGLRQSVTAVERLRTYGGRPACLELHIVRWRRTVDDLAIAILVDEAEIARRIEMLIQRNETWCRRVGDFGITMLATPGPSLEGNAQPTEMMHLNPLDHAKIQRHRTLGQPLVITDVQQPSAKSWPRDIKVRCRLHYYLADRAARQIDPSAGGLLVDADGSVTETSVASVAICRDGQIVSPPTEQVLPGTTQQVVQDLAVQLGLAWTHETLFPADVRQADEVWLMGTDGGLWFADRVDGVPIGDGSRGPMYQKLLAAFDDAMA